MDNDNPTASQLPAEPSRGIYTRYPNELSQDFLGVMGLDPFSACPAPSRRQMFTPILPHVAFPDAPVLPKHQKLLDEIEPLLKRS